MTRSFVAIVNAAAGGGRCMRRFEQLRPALEARGLTLDVRPTTRPGHATELARAALAEGARRFLSVGGDGTTFEVVNGLFPVAPPEIELAILPLGTGNSFLRDFRIDDEAKAIEAVCSGTPRPVDVVRMTHSTGSLHYVNLLGLGFTASVGKLTNDRFKALGPAGYVAAVVTKVATLEHPLDPVRLDGGAEDARPAAMLVFSNSRYTGGAMMMAPTAELADGKLDVIRVGALSRLALLRQFPRIFSGTHVNGGDVTETKASRVEFTAPRMQPCMIDGEVLMLEPRGLEVLPSALRVIA